MSHIPVICLFLINSEVQAKANSRKVALNDHQNVVLPIFMPSEKSTGVDIDKIPVNIKQNENRRVKNNSLFTINCKIP
jgi:hypothetical protein